MPALALVRSTYGRKIDAETAADKLIEGRLAACVHLHPIQSAYRWKGKVEREKEWLLEARCRSEDVDGVWGALLDGHPYETPLVEVVGDAQVPARYMAWAKRVTKRD